MTTIPKMDLLRERLLSAVKPYLKSPFSAVLCSADELNITKTFIDETSYLVKGYVNAQNSYGAMMKTDFSATAKFINDDWKISNVSVGIQTMKNNAKSFAVNYVAISIFVAIMGLIGYFIISAAIN